MRSSITISHELGNKQTRKQTNNPLQPFSFFCVMKNNPRFASKCSFFCLQPSSGKSSEFLQLSILFQSYSEQEFRLTARTVLETRSVTFYVPKPFGGDKWKESLGAQFGAFCLEVTLKCKARGCKALCSLQSATFLFDQFWTFFSPVHFRVLHLKTLK